MPVVGICSAAFVAPARPGRFAFTARDTPARLFVLMTALGCIVYEVVKAHGNLSTALADAKVETSQSRPGIGQRDFHETDSGDKP
jgi:hypothetical protein